MATIYARLINQYKFKYHIILLASFYKINEEDQRSDETKLFNTLNVNNKLTKNDIGKIDIKFKRLKNLDGFLIKIFH